MLKNKEQISRNKNLQTKLNTTTNHVLLPYVQSNHSHENQFKYKNNKVINKAKNQNLTITKHHIPI